MSGYGVVSAAGSGAEAAWVALAAGRPAGGPWTPPDGGTPAFAAPIPENYRPHPRIPRNLVHFLDGPSAYTLDAVFQALAMAGIEAGGGDARRFAIVDALPYRAPGQPAIFSPAGHLLARTLGTRGPVTVIAAAEAGALSAVIAARRLLQTNTVDVVIAGASQGLQPALLAHLKGERMSSDAPARPFDEGHSGLVPAEGAAWFVLEREEHARERGASVRARIAGAAELFDALAEPLAAPDAAAAGRVLQEALGDAGYIQNQVDLVVSAADGRPAFDFADGYGIKRTFGRHAHYASVTSVAGTLGSALAASGGLSLAAALESLARQQSFPLASFATPEQDLDLAYVRELRPEKLDTVLVTSLGTGGACAALVMERAD